MNKQPTYVTEGEQFGDHTVAAKCDGPSSMGYWYCAEHGPLAHNMAASSHTAAKCKLAWYCFNCNRVEVP